MEQNNHNMENKEEQHHSAQKRRVPAQRAHASTPQANHAQSGNTTGNSSGNAGYPRRRKKNSGAIITVAVIALFVILAAAVMALLFYKPTFRPDDHPLNSDDMSGVILTDASGNVVPDVVRDEERVNFLVMGRDNAGLNTDVIMLLSYDVKNGAISLMQFPRDTYFDVGQGNCKINAALALFYNRRRREGLSDDDAYKAAMSDMEKSIEDVFRITIDYYAIMNLNGFVNIIDALGGVEMDVPTRMYYKDPAQNLTIDLQPGLQTLTGAQAEQFVRFRKGYVEGDIGRVDAQKLFIGACIAQVKKNFNVSTISTVMDQVMKNVVTDIPLQDMVYYAKSALSVDLSKITMLTLPGIQCRQHNDSGTWYYVAYRDGTVAALNKYFNTYNFDITPEIFDRDDVLYDDNGSYMHSIYLTKNAEEESYTADKTDDIYIYRYSSTGTKPSTTASTEVTEPAETPVPEGSDSTVETDLTVGSDGDVHTDDTDEPPVTDAPEDTAPFETVDVPADTTGENEAGEDAASTSEIEVTDAPTEPDENN